MLKGLIILVSLQLIGEAITTYLDIPIPGAIIGMLLLLIYLMIKGYVDEELSSTATHLFPYLPLLLIPASVGVIQYGELLEKEGLSIIAALVISVICSFFFVPFFFKLLKSILGHKG